MAELNKRERISRRWASLKTERSSWDSHWLEISQSLLPRSGRFLVTDQNKGGKKHNAIYDSTGTRALRVLAAGMMSGMTSPARPWFRLTTSDPQLDESFAVKMWLSDVTRRMSMVFNKSNTYRALHSMYEELGAFGTASSIVVPDFKTIIHHHPLTIGEYALATDARGNVNTIYRESQMTVAQLVAEFGYKQCSNTVQGLHDRGALDQWVTVIHGIEPRTERDTRMKDAANMAWRSCYFELGGTDGCDVAAGAGADDDDVELLAHDVLFESGSARRCGRLPLNLGGLAKSPPRGRPEVGPDGWALDGSVKGDATPGAASSLQFSWFRC